MVPGLYYNGASQLDAGIDLRYVQRYKTNHKSAILGQDGFLGTMSEYEGLFDAFPVEDTATPGAAGDCESNLTFVLSCRSVSYTHLTLPTKA